MRLREMFEGAATKKLPFSPFHFYFRFPFSRYDDDDDDTRVPPGRRHARHGGRNRGGEVRSGVSVAPLPCSKFGPILRCALCSFQLYNVDRKFGDLMPFCVIQLVL